MWLLPDVAMQILYPLDITRQLKDVSQVTYEAVSYRESWAKLTTSVSNPGNSRAEILEKL